MSRSYGGPVLEKMVRYHRSRKEDEAEAESVGEGGPTVRFAFFVDSKGKLYYRKFYILDFRSYRFEWQKKALPTISQLLDRDGIKICCYKVSRRQGKTWLCTLHMLEFLFATPTRNPRGVFLCLQLNQAERNTKEALESHMSKLPGAHFDGGENKWIIPKPTKAHPKNQIEFLIIGAHGNIESKVGGRWDIAGIDEGDGFGIEFIERVVIIPLMDNAGVMFIFGTEFSDGEVLDHYSGRARRMEVIKKAVDDGTWKGKLPATLNQYHTFEATARETGVYDGKLIDQMQEILTPETFAQELENKNVKLHLRYYYRAKMSRPGYQSSHLVQNLGPIPHLPAFFYIDIGIGNKSDRMAFCLIQHTQQGMITLWGDDIPNATIKDIPIMYRDFCPFKQIPVLEWVLPHDAESRDVTHVTAEQKLREAIPEVLGHTTPITRCLTRPHTKKYPIDIGAGFLDKTVFHAVHAYPIWEALFYHRRKEVPAKSGIYADVPSKTKYRDRVDSWLLGCRDQEEKTHLTALARFGGDVGVRPRAVGMPERVNGVIRIPSNVPHPELPTGRPNYSRLDFVGF